MRIEILNSSVADKFYHLVNKITISNGLNCQNSFAHFFTPPPHLTRGRVTARNRLSWHLHTHKFRHRASELKTFGRIKPSPPAKLRLYSGSQRSEFNNLRFYQKLEDRDPPSEPPRFYQLPQLKNTRVCPDRQSTQGEMWRQACYLPAKARSSRRALPALRRSVLSG